MEKEIVSKEEIQNDSVLSLIKKFRILNKRAGKAKVECNATEFYSCLEQMEMIAKEIHSKGFKIWVNENGRTGHNYTKDYKETDPADNRVNHAVGTLLDRLVNLSNFNNCNLN